MYNRLYFYAVGQDYDDLVEKLNEFGFIFLTGDNEANPNLDFDLIASDRRLWFLSLKAKNQIRLPYKSVNHFSETTFDVASWTRGRIHKRQLVGHMIKQTLPYFKKPNPTPLDLEIFEDARALRKAISSLRRWMKKNWIAHFEDRTPFGPEAYRLLTEEGYLSASYELDNPPSEIITIVR